MATTLDNLERTVRPLDIFNTSVVSNDSLHYQLAKNASYVPPQYINLPLYFSHTLEWRIILWMHIYLPPVLILLGTVGNALSFWVLRRSSKQCSVFLYMALYALMNTLNLYMACGLSWISQITQTPHIANLADWLCRIWQFVFTVMRYTSTWLVVAMAFDRFIYLALPSWVHNLCTVFTAKIFSCLIFIVLVVIGIHAMWTFELKIDQGCIIDNERRDFQTLVWPWLAAMMHTYLPTIVIIVFDSIIITNWAMLSARRYQNRNFSPVQEQLTKVVLVINISFLVLTLPSTILNLITYLVPTEFIHNPENYVQIMFSTLFCQYLLYLLCCINFPVYFLSLPMLRAEFVKMMKQRSRNSSSDTPDIACSENCLNISEANGKLLNKTEANKNLENTLITQL